MIRVAELQRYDQVQMTSFKWEPEGRASVGSLAHFEHNIFLVKKNNSQYQRLQHFEVLNSEIRSLLFKHAYGYDLALKDFGRLESIQNTTLRLRLP